MVGVDAQDSYTCSAGFAGCDAFAVFPLVVARPETFGIMAGTYQKDSDALLVDSGSRMCNGGFTGDSAPRAVFLFPVVRPKILCILAGMDHKDSFSSRSSTSLSWRKDFSHCPDVLWTRWPMPL